MSESVTTKGVPGGRSGIAGVVLHLMWIVPLVYLLAILQVQKVRPQLATSWFSISSPLSEKVADALPIANRYTRHLEANGYGKRVAVVRNLIAAIWILAFPFLVTLLVLTYLGRYHPVGRLDPRRPAQGALALLGATAVVGVVALWGPEIRFGEYTHRHRVAIHSSNTFFFIYVATIWLGYYFICALFGYWLRATAKGT